MPNKLTVKDKSFSDPFFATCVSPSHRTGKSTSQTITHFEDESSVTHRVWSYVDEPHAIQLGQRALLQHTTMPNGKVFTNLA